jgi:hypothetical protein
MLLERFEMKWRERTGMCFFNGLVCVHKNEGLTLKHEGLLYLPVNTASYMQPLDQGIIYCMKQAH